MTTCIIGAGLSGLALSIYLKLHSPSKKIIIITDGKSGNTMMAGQRYRPSIKMPEIDAERLFIDLLKERNGEEATIEMETFARSAKQELEFWANLHPKDIGADSDPLFWEQRPNWFGPQFGRPNRAGFGRGKNLISWLTKLATHLGVDFVRGSANKIKRVGERVTALDYSTERQSYTLICENYVLSGGSIGGTLFNSTNVTIHNSPQELAFAAGLDLVGGTLNMFHILGYTNRSGEIKVGCFETDNLEHAEIYLKNKASDNFTIFDKETTHLLATHQAHYHFAAIAKKFLAHGGIVEIRLPGERPTYGRVSHHYSHMGIKTEDGVKACNTKNLFAIGDASSTGYWTGHQVRHPGVALSNCLVTAKLAAIQIMEKFRSSRNAEIYINASANRKNCSASTIKEIKEINTEHLMNIEFGLTESLSTSKMWEDRLVGLKNIHPEHTILDISIQLSKAFQTGNHPREPLAFSKEN